MEHRMSSESIEAWFKHEVLSRPEDYPWLADLEKKKNAWRFNNSHKQ